MNVIHLLGKAYSDDQMIGTRELAAWLGKSEFTIKSDAKRKPESLPQATRLPGSNLPRWRVGTVRDWLDRYEPVA